MMKSFTKHLSKIAFIAVFVLSGIFAANAQGEPARLRFEKLNGLETRARDVVEVNVEGKLLDLARRVLMKQKDPNAQKVGVAIKDLKAIYVRVYTFEKENEYNPADIEEIRAQLSAPGWEKLANVRSKRNNQKIDVYTMFTGDVMSGVAVVLSEAKTIALVNIIGPIDIDMLAELGGKLNIPKIDIEKESENK